MIVISKNRTPIENLTLDTLPYIRYVFVNDRSQSVGYDDRNQTPN